jgi:hypothetical protein
MKTSPKHIIQIFDNSLSYTKKLKSFEDRKSISKWNKKIISKSGYIENGVLNLNRDTQKNPLSSNTILLVDFNRLEDSQKAESHILNGEITASAFTWSIFKFRRKETIEINLNWNYWDLGDIKREQFKLAELKENQPIEIKINGKRDFSLSSRRERLFLEKNFIIQYLGTIEKINLVPKSDFISEKKIPIDRKLINLMKRIK